MVGWEDVDGVAILGNGRGAVVDAGAAERKEFGIGVMVSSEAEAFRIPVWYACVLV